MRKKDLSTDTTFDPCWFSLDYTFKANSFVMKKQLSKSEDFSHDTAHVTWYLEDVFIFRRHRAWNCWVYINCHLKKPTCGALTLLAIFL